MILALLLALIGVCLIKLGCFIAGFQFGLEESAFMLAIFSLFFNKLISLMDEIEVLDEDMGRLEKNHK